ncbi:facilitated trehalose transporter Tret1-like [Choristoneura fumiferana]|uniref:facilitated trehalose transporter Tret1-like n=1 Tax=Choristoneura fumiferana TaxID=7141 RepID=UPI003D15B549
MNLIIQKLVFHNGSRFNQYLFAVVLTIPLLSFGMIQGWLSPMLASLKSPDGPSQTPFTSSDISWMTSVTYITAIVLGAPLGYLTDRFGRKIMSLVTIFSLVVYWSIKLCSLEPWALITARAVAGFPCSACYIVLPIYLKEISDKEIRGALGSLIILGRNVGYLSSYIGADLLNVRVMLWLGFAVPVFVFLVFLAMPETPEFLIKEGKVNEARAVLAWLKGRSICDRELQLEIDGLVHRAKQSTAEPKSAWSTILRDPITFKAFVITIVIKIAQQFDGYLIVLIYAGFVFEQASASSSMRLSANKQVMVVGAVQLVGSIVATTLVEKTGRKMLLVSTSFVVGLGMLLLSAWFYLTAAGVWLPGWIPVIAMCTCIFADAAGFQPISYIIITDMFTFQLRGTVSTFANILAKGANFIQMKWFHKLNQAVGIHWTLFFFAVVCFFASFYSLVFFPETKRKSIEEIYSELAGKKNKSSSNA